MNKPKVGLLPLYVKLYDDYLQWMRPRIEAFHKTITAKLESEGLEVLTVAPCRLEAEFKAALDSYEAAGCDAVITVHLAYSPSLQSEKPLRECRLPLIILDTTPDLVFSPEGPSAQLDFDHGIHGVQDMCNLLNRNHVPFDICAGHWQESRVVKRVADLARGYAAAKALSSMKVGIIGDPFDGMGDFRVPYEEVKKDLGTEIVKYPASAIGAYAKKVTESRIDEAQKEDEARFENKNVPDALYREVMRASLAVKDWIEAEGLGAFTLNFLEAGKNTGLRHMVFDRACRAMEEGVGYAGEGDALTAALVGALLTSFPETTFVEMFCPNWRDGYVFLGHMGEYNLRIAAEKPHMVVRPFPFGDAGDPFALMASMKKGRSVLVNLAPLGDGQYTLTTIEGEMLPAPVNSDFKDLVNGWFKPDRRLEEVLEEYSRNGGTHHSAMVYGVSAEAIKPLARQFGWKFVTL